MGPVGKAKDNDSNGDPPVDCHTFRLFSSIPGLVHAVFTRHGGVSRGPYRSLNVAWGNGDCPADVAENIRRIKDFLHLQTMVAAPQVHGNAIHLVDEAAVGGYEDKGSLFQAPPGDALVTRLQGVGLLIKVADCQAVFIVDPVRRVIANVHCGWRGSVGGIVPQTVDFLVEHLGSDPRDLMAAVGPSLGPCCAEFVHYRDELPAAFHGYQRSRSRFDFWAITRDQLVERGVSAERIELARRCTVCETDNFFSYRRERRTGRFAAVIAWRS